MVSNEIRAPQKLTLRIGLTIFIANLPQYLFGYTFYHTGLTIDDVENMGRLLMGNCLVKLGRFDVRKVENIEMNKDI